MDIWNKIWRLSIIAVWIVGVFKAPDDWGWLSMMLSAGVLLIIHEIRFKD